jgi:hypothetical protein
VTPFRSDHAVASDAPADPAKVSEHEPEMQPPLLCIRVIEPMICGSKEASRTLRCGRNIGVICACAFRDVRAMPKAHSSVRAALRSSFIVGFFLWMVLNRQWAATHHIFTRAIMFYAMIVTVLVAAVLIENGRGNRI